MKKNILIITMLIGFSTMCFSQSHIDVVYLKDGSIIRGLVIEQIPDKQVKVETYDGSIFVYNIDQVEKITKELNRNRRRENRNRQNTVIATDDYYRKTLRGYKGFVDTGYTFGDYESFEMNTSHGFQFNNYIFVGGGLGVHYYPDIEWTSVPIFANFRANFINRRITPFADVKAGYTYGDLEGVYASIGLGLRVTLKNKMALNFIVSYSGQDDESEYYWGGYYWDYSTEGFGIKVGFEF